MHKKLTGLALGAALALTGTAQAAKAVAAPSSNEAATARHFAALVAGAQPKTAELSLFFSMMPKGGDLHHHYSGAIYAEQFLDWVDKENYCVNKTTYRIESNKDVVAAERAKPAAQRGCLSSTEVFADAGLYAELLQRWSTKDFYNHGAIQTPPDRTFFDTFGYFGPVASSNTADGLKTLKQRAIAENLSYIETIFELSPFVQNAQFDQQVLAPGLQPAALQAVLANWTGSLEQDASFQKSITAYNDNVNASSAGIDDANFTMRYQAYVLRFLSPSQVFSSMVAAFKAASLNPLLVGVNIVGQESVNVSMRDYSLHMEMFKFLKAKYPNVKIALHAGELALGMVPPEGMTFHIAEAVDVAGADRIGHGMDIAYENNALATMQKMRERNIPVEVNLTSNDYILGIKGQAHPITLYRKYGVPFVISTDDAGVSRNTLSNEYVLFASQYKTDYAEIKKLSYNSLRYSFLAEADKQRLLKALDARFTRFEALIANSDRKATVVKP
ncbi:adenosine deaminase family protein [Janthinobacterium lividum]|uniref:adenosine deaminase family protein n=1 Tax=Janthinobacterium TaxID=29580 RepID=UPI000886E09D|nr:MULTISPECIES: adenosine deaminase [Janthinobacterium]MBR7636271.1 adenosine deaminase [Janthinobacterium lividum]SDH83814.1 adenosine deaminase [Janthinobacterium sp. YR213]